MCEEGVSVDYLEDQASGGARARSREIKRNSGGVRSRRGATLPDCAFFGAAADGAHHQSMVVEQKGQKNSSTETSAA